MEAAVSQVFVRGGRTLSEGEPFWSMRGGMLREHRCERIVCHAGDTERTCILEGCQIFHPYEVWSDRAEATASYRKDLLDRSARLEAEKRRVTAELARIEAELAGGNGGGAT